MYKDTWYKMPLNVNLSVPMIERENVTDELRIICDLLKKNLEEKYFFSCGTALGIVRDKKLIDWDTDIDIDIINPSESEISALISNMLNLGYTFYRKLQRNNRMLQLVFVKEPYHSIDFVFWYYEKDYLINDVPELTFLKRIHKTQLYNEFKFIKWNGLDIRIPKQHDQYFKCLYGEYWTKPKKYSLWISNAYDLKIDFYLLRVLLKISWKIESIIKKIINKLFR